IVDLQLKTPDEEIVSHDNFHSFPGVDYQFGDTYSFYEVDKPKPGDWQVTLYGREIDQKSEQVNLTVSGNSPLLANIFGLQSYYRRGEPIQIKVKIADLFTSEQASYSDFKVTAVIKKPSPNMKKMIQKGKIDFGELFLYALTKKKKINLYDDGRHGDWNASDDIYGALYKDTEEIGHYVITITCKAKKADGEEITRVLRESVQVGPMEDRTVTLADFLMVK
ncbi:MAG: choice-of-anchor X domain-containing protein, partial [Atribacterota bacterium]